MSDYYTIFAVAILLCMIPALSSSLPVKNLLGKCHTSTWIEVCKVHVRFMVLIFAIHIFDN